MNNIECLLSHITITTWYDYEHQTILLNNLRNHSREPHYNINNIVLDSNFTQNDVNNKE
jgi:hypothetical protein